MLVSDYVRIDKELTIMLPDDKEMERITNLYHYCNKDDFLELRSRYIWLYTLMYRYVSICG